MEYGNQTCRPIGGLRDLVVKLAAAAALIGWFSAGSGAFAADRAADRAAIAEMTACYADGVDIIGNNWPKDKNVDQDVVRAADRFKECIADDAKIKLFVGTKQGEGLPAATGPVEFATFVRNYFGSFGTIGTQHIVGNVVVKFSGPKEAHVVSYIHASHWLADGRVLVVPVRYEDVAIENGGTWKIAKRDVIAQRFWIGDGYYPKPDDPKLARPQ